MMTASESLLITQVAVSAASLADSAPPVTITTMTGDSATAPKRSASDAGLSNHGDGNHGDDEQKLQSRREANRMHAFKSRQRSKSLLAELQTTVEQLSAEKSELERHNAVLRAQVEVLHQQNLTLLQNQQQMVMQQQQYQQQQMQPPAPAMPPPGNNPPATWPPANAQVQPPAAPMSEQQQQQAQAQNMFSSFAGNPFMASLSQLAAANPSLMMAAAAAGMMGAAVNPMMMPPQQQQMQQQLTPTPMAPPTHTLPPHTQHATNNENHPQDGSGAPAAPPFENMGETVGGSADPTPLPQQSPSAAQNDLRLV
jgi:hypothetical protein